MWQNADMACLQAFQQAGQAQGFTFSSLPKIEATAARKQLQEAVGQSEYFLAILPDGSKLVHTITRDERHPLDFGRQVVAQLDGRPDRYAADACILLHVSVCCCGVRMMQTSASAILQIADADGDLADWAAHWVCVKS